MPNLFFTVWCAMNGILQAGEGRFVFREEIRADRHASPEGNGCRDGCRLSHPPKLVSSRRQAGGANSVHLMFHSIPSKLVSTLPKEKRLKQACSIAVSGLQTTLSIAKDVTGLAGVPGLQAGISSLLVVIDAIKACHISLCWCLLVTFNGPENGTKRGGYRETGKPDRGIECLSEQREDWENISSGDR
jgi:hypothetical protein